MIRSYPNKVTSFLIKLKLDKVENDNIQFVYNEFPVTSFIGIEGLEAADVTGLYNVIKDGILSLVDREEFVPNL